MKKQKWNDDWKVWKEDNAFRLIFSVPAYAKEVTLPYDAVFHEAQKRDSVNAGKTGFLDGGVYNYYKKYFAPLDEKGKTIQLLLDGAGGKTFVYVNGSMARECNYPYQSFYVDLSNYLMYGEENEILVMVYAMDCSSRYYVGGGLFRDVYLLKGGDTYIVPDTTRITTLRMEEQNAYIRFETMISNQEVYATDLNVNLIVRNAKKEIIKNSSFPIRVKGKEGYKFSKSVCVENVEAWDEEHPSMYTVEVSILDSGKQVIDQEMIETGFRTLSIDAKNGLMVNGRKLKLRGACIHHDQGLLGGATYDAYEYRRILKLKEAGFNAVRSAHNPASKALLKACDHLGVYVMDEAFDMWARMKNPSDYSLFFEKGYKEVLETMVAVDYNHPSVILYSTGNEITDVATEKGYELSNKMTNILHQLDATRYVTNGINGIFAAGNRLIEAFEDISGEAAPAALKGDINQCMSTMGRYLHKIVCHPAIDKLLERLDATMDVIGYNYMTARYENDCKNYEDRVIVGTETYPRQIAENWEAIQKNNAIIGEFTWTGYDYLGETGDRYPDLQNTSGDLDVLGERRPISYYREIVFGLRETPYLAVRSPELTGQPRPFGPWKLTDAEPIWNYLGSEGKMVTVEVYSAGDEIELFLNGESFGKKPRDGEVAYMNTYDIPYMAGELKVISYKDNQILGICTLVTPKSEEKFQILAEKYAISEEETMAFVTITTVDNNLSRVYKNIEELQLRIDGIAELLAFGSSELKPENGYRNTMISTQNGMAMAVLKVKNGEESRITVSADGFTTANISV